MFCQECGNKIEINSKFCGGCGSQVQQPNNKSIYEVDSAMTFMKSISVCFSKYADFKGRAKRAEYWWFYFFTTLVQIIFSLIINILPENSSFSSMLSGLYILFILAIIIPSVAVGARRLHDSNKSGWWMLIPLTIIGIPYFWYLLIKKGDLVENNYGSSD